MSHLEELARELESIHDRADELKPLVQHVRDDAYDRKTLVTELLDARLGFFAYKLNSGYYDQYAEEFAKHMTQVSADQEVQAIAKEAAEDAEASREEDKQLEEEKKEESGVSQEPEATESDTTAENQESTEQTATDTAENQTEGETAADSETPAVSNLPHCPSCAGFHVSHTQEHPYQIPDQAE